jgi:hypothetical protein
MLTLPMGGLHVKHVVQRGIWVPTEASTLGPRKTTENLDGVGQSQDFPDVNQLLASSPALNTRTVTVVPIWQLIELKKKVHIFVLTDLCTIIYKVYKNSVRTWQEAHYVPATKPNRLILFRETVAVYCENHMEHINAMLRLNVNF